MAHVLTVLLFEVLLATAVATALTVWARRNVHAPTRAQRKAARAAMPRQGSELVEPAMRCKP